jgi:hypothetical protein
MHRQSASFNHWQTIARIEARAIADTAADLFYSAWVDLLNSLGHERSLLGEDIDRAAGRDY